MKSKKKNDMSPHIKEEEKVEEEEEDEEEDFEFVPLPIQTFLWSQTSPFICPKLGKINEASCMDQREVCKSFEKVIVQNLQFGLSPSLTQAIRSISRWRFIQAAFPHVMQCCASLLYQRRSGETKLGASETKLLYTLHWILLDAAEECADDLAKPTLPAEAALFPISSIQVFVYLFAPLTDFLKYSDFMTNFRLENGVKIWQPFWEHRHPDIPYFSSLVRPTKEALRAARAHTRFGDVFLGDSTSPDNQSDPRSTTSSTKPLPKKEPKKAGTETPSKVTAEGLRREDPCLATYLDVAVVRCFFVSQWLEEGIFWGLNYWKIRLKEIAEKLSRQVAPRRRSTSLPIPKMEISFHEMLMRDHTVDTFFFGSEPSYHSSMQELHHFRPAANSKLGEMENRLRRSEQGLHRIQNNVILEEESGGLKKKKKKTLKDSISMSELRPPRPQSAQGLMDHKGLLRGELVRGRSLPSLHISGLEPPPTREHTIPTQKTPAHHTHSVPNPIITVTEHSPVNSVQFFINQEGSESPRGHKLARSQTDSHIDYGATEEREVAEATHYVGSRGEISLPVILQAMHSVSRHTVCSLRVACAVVDNLLSLLQLIPPGQIDLPAALDTLVSITKHLGCPFGCEGGAPRPPDVEDIRSQIKNALLRLQQQDETVFRKFFHELVVSRYSLAELMDFLHAFLGFCSENNSLLSPLSSGATSQQKRPSSSAETRTGYSSNFGAGAGNVGHKNIEGIIVTHFFKPLITRLVKFSPELHNQENMGLFCDVRQLVCYIKNNHGGVFRRVALSGLLDIAERPHIKNPQTYTRIVRHTKSLDHSDDISLYSPTVLSMDDVVPEKTSRKSFFRRKGVRKPPSSLNLGDEEITPSPSMPSMLRHHRPLTPRLSVPADEDMGASPRHRGTPRFPIVSWLKGSGGDDRDTDEEGSSPPEERPSLSRRASSRHRGGPSRSASNMSLTLLRKRMEDHLTRIGFGRPKNKHGGCEEPQDLSRRNSLELEHRLREGEFLMMKESRLVDIVQLRAGLQRFTFLQECCQPGMLPDPPLLAALLDLKAPVVARAAIYLECANFVHRCNKGQWPGWLKLSLSMFRPLGTRSLSAGQRHRSYTAHRAAGQLFYHWAEALGSRLEEMLQDEQKMVDTVPPEDSARRLHRLEDEEEDFLDEVCVNSKGNECPFALKVAACQLLVEVTTFMRETFQYLPHRLSASARRTADHHRSITANRRWSMAFSSLGFGQTSGHSLASLAAADHPPAAVPPVIAAQGERKISFVLHEAEHDSENSSTTTLHEETLEVDKKGRRNTRSQLFRRAPGSSHANSSFKRRSFKLRNRRLRARCSTFVEDDDDGSQGAGGLRRSDSLKSRRKVSMVSDRSDTSDRNASGGEESPGVLSDEQLPDSPLDPTTTPLDNNVADDTMARNLPWAKAMVKLIHGLDFSCPHQYSCPPRCFRRQMRACNRLSKAIGKVYGDKDDIDHAAEKHREDKEDPKKNKKLKKLVTAPSSPLKRRPSLEHLHGSSAQLAANVDLELGLHQAASSSAKTAETPQRTPPAPDNPMLRYMKSQVKSLFSGPLITLIKSAVVLPDATWAEVLPLAWNFLMEADQQLVASAAVVFILGSVRCMDLASELMLRQLKDENPLQRIEAIHKFQVLWKLRYQCWPRMEEGAHMLFKVPPPAIEFTLPSPKLAVEQCPIVDPPWLPLAKAKVEEVTINQDQSRSFVAATKTRRKQQQELIQNALQAEEERLRNEREAFLLTGVNILGQAAHEPSLYHAAAATDDHEDGEEEQTLERPSSHHLQVAQPLFPAALCRAMLPLLGLLEDIESSVYCSAWQAIWQCLSEDPALFLRHGLERLTREGQSFVFRALRQLCIFHPRLPPQAAHVLYNYLIGFVMFYVRSPVESSTELIGSALSILWQVVPSVHGLFLKDLKQVLRKEQCDASLLITANVPSAKKIIVHGPDVSGIPSQFPIHEDTQFFHILQDSLDFFGIPESQHNSYFLVDTKTSQMHSLDSYVRDYYFFKRSQYSQLSLVHMNPDTAFEVLQRQAFNRKFVELGKVLMSLSILKSNVQMAQRVFFLHEELTKLPSFPRKALEADFSLFTGLLGQEMLGMESLHKLVWVKLVARMLEAMAGLFVHSSDILLLLNVVNGALVLHTEDAAVLRLCMATYLNAALHFRSIFASNGYLLIMPTILRSYSNHQTNGLLCRTLEFVCKQFYIMHRKPFILQMFGSVAPILDMDPHSSYGDASKVQPQALFQLVQSLEVYVPDPLDILELVEAAEKPLRPLDFCYQSEPDSLSLLDAISLCVTVVAYAADSLRAYHMLVILEALLPFYLKHLQGLTARKETPGGSRAELSMIHTISVCMKTLISNSEALTRNYTGPQRTIDPRSSSIKNASKGACSPPYEMDEDSHSNSRRAGQPPQPEDSDSVRAEFRKPRDTLLYVVSEFLTKCSARLAELSKKIPDLSSKATELLDVKCHLRLAEVAHSLLKVSPYDPATMGCRGLQRYLTEVLPHTEWAHENIRPALITVLRRLDKTFAKIAKKTTIRRLVDWDAARVLLKGVYLTLHRHPYIAHLPHLKSLIATCQGIVLGDQTAVPADSSCNLPATALALGQTTPAGFVAVVVRLVAMQMVALGESQSLEVVCGGAALFSSPEKSHIYLMNLILPMCIRICSGVKDVPKIRPSDINFALCLVLHTLSPVVPAKNKGGGDQLDKSYSRIQIGFLGLKILIVCFESQLSTEWHRIACCIRELGNKSQGGIALWNFLDFVVTHRTPLFLLLYPFVKYKLLQTICDSEQEYNCQQVIRDKLQGQGLSTPRSRGSLFLDLVADMRSLREDLVTWKMGGPRCPSFTELTPDQQSVTRLGNPPGLLSSSATSRQPSISGTSSSKAPSLSRNLSTRSEKFFPSGIRVQSRRAMERFMTRRTSYPDGAEIPHAEPLEPGASSEPRLYRKSTLHFKKQRGSRKSERSTGPLSPPPLEHSDTNGGPASPGGTVHSPDSDSQKPRHRLQRQKAQSRKTFRFRKSRRGEGFSVYNRPGTAASSPPEDSPDIIAPQTSMVAEEPPPPSPPTPTALPEDDDESSIFSS